jgi:hypothetical protein
MSLWDFMLSPEMAPFSAAFGLIGLFFLLELISLVLGSSLFGLGGDADVDLPDAGGPDIDVPGLHAPDLHAPDLHAPDLHAHDLGGHDGGAHAGGVLGWLGLGDAPFMVWLSALLLGFGLTGYVGQLVARELVDGLLPALPVAAVAAVAGFLFARRVSRVVARLLPRVQTSAVSETRLGGRVGVITVGTARLGSPAEAKVTDHFGNVHYIRVVPMQQGEELPAGTEIAVMQGRDRIYTAVRLDK